MAGKEKPSLGAAAAWVPLAVNESLLGSSTKHSPGYEMVGGIAAKFTNLQEEGSVGDT